MVIQAKHRIPYKSPKMRESFDTMQIKISFMDDFIVKWILHKIMQSLFLDFRQGYNVFIKITSSFSHKTVNMKTGLFNSIMTIIRIRLALENFF